MQHLANCVVDVNVAEGRVSSLGVPPEVVIGLVTRYWLLDRSYLVETADHEDQDL